MSFIIFVGLLSTIYIAMYSFMSFMYVFPILLSTLFKPADVKPESKPKPNHNWTGTEARTQPEVRFGCPLSCLCRVWVSDLNLPSEITTGRWAYP